MVAEDKSKVSRQIRKLSFLLMVGPKHIKVVEEVGKILSIEIVIIIYFVSRMIVHVVGLRLSLLCRLLVYNVENSKECVEFYLSLHSNNAVWITRRDLSKPPQLGEVQRFVPFLLVGTFTAIGP